MAGKWKNWNDPRLGWGYAFDESSLILWNGELEPRWESDEPGIHPYSRNAPPDLILNDIASELCHNGMYSTDVTPWAPVHTTIANHVVGDGGLPRSLLNDPIDFSSDPAEWSSAQRLGLSSDTMWRFWHVMRLRTRGDQYELEIDIQGGDVDAELPRGWPVLYDFPDDYFGHRISVPRCAFRAEYTRALGRPHPLDPSCRTADVMALARCIAEGDNTILPILGDALEDAGCADPAILSHCRESCVHARRCWVLDAVLVVEP